MGEQETMGGKKKKCNHRRQDKGYVGWVGRFVWLGVTNKANEESEYFS